MAVRKFKPVPLVLLLLNDVIPFMTRTTPIGGNTIKIVQWWNMKGNVSVRMAG